MRVTNLIALIIFMLISGCSRTSWDLATDMKVHERMFRKHNNTLFEHTKSNGSYALTLSQYKKIKTFVTSMEQDRYFIVYELAHDNEHGSLEFNFVLFFKAGIECENLVFGEAETVVEDSDLNLMCKKMFVKDSQIGMSTLTSIKNMLVAGDGLPLYGLIEISSGKVVSRKAKILKLPINLPLADRLTTAFLGESKDNPEQILFSR